MLDDKQTLQIMFLSLTPGCTNWTMQGMTWLRPYARLVRLPNLPTPLADIALAGLAVDALPRRWPAFVLLLLASACLYMAGMVWNDFFDVEQDARERPERPIPSRQISRRSAGVLGAALLSAGVLLALVAGGVLVLRDEKASALLPGILAALLAAAILLYDGWLKRTWLGPVAMGSCRFLNVLMGVSLSGSLAWPLGTHLALVVGTYIVGVTWFARTEARTSSKPSLVGAAAVMLAALILAVPLPVHRPANTASPLFPYLLVIFGFVVGLPISRAIMTPAPENVQAGVKRALMGLILLDTVLATATAGTVGLVLLVLLIPSLYLYRRRWLYAT
jgi:4-hydroxybenzoate polyprenyltransferase